MFAEEEFFRELEAGLSFVEIKKLLVDEASIVKDGSLNQGRA